MIKNQRGKQIAVTPVAIAAGGGDAGKVGKAWIASVIIPEIIHQSNHHQHFCSKIRTSEDCWTWWISRLLSRCCYPALPQKLSSKEKSSLAYHSPDDCLFWRDLCPFCSSPCWDANTKNLKGLFQPTKSVAFLQCTIATHYIGRVNTIKFINKAKPRNILCNCCSLKLSLIKLYKLFTTWKSNFFQNDEKSFIHLILFCPLPIKNYGLFKCHLNRATAAQSLIVSLSFNFFNHWNIHSLATLHFR